VKETRLATHYSMKLVKDWSGENEAHQAVSSHLLELTPKPTAPVVWAKIVYELWERDAVVMPKRAQYFRRSSDTAPERTLEFSHVKQLGGRLVPTQMLMRVAKSPGEFTRITYNTLEFDVVIPPDKFTEQALRR
jgi:hypothetical protein